MVMAIAGAAVLTQIQGIVSDQTGSIMAAYAVPVSYTHLDVYKRQKVYRYELAHVDLLMEQFLFGYHLQIRCV